jgi:hypothetical protein
VDTKMKIDGVSPSVQPNVAGSSAAQAPLQNVKAGIWASSPGSSTSTHKTRDDPNEKQAKALVRWAMKASKREPASLPTKLAEAFLGANPAVREAIRKNSAYQGIIAKWAREVGDALNGPRTTIHPGDQGMHKLHDLAIGLPPDLAQDLVVAATPVFVNGNGAIFSSNDKVPVSDLSPDVEASKPSPDDEASKPSPDVGASQPAPDVEGSKANPDDEASKPSPDREASTAKYKDYTYIDDLKDWIRRAEVPNPRGAIEQLEKLIDKP